MSGELRFRFYSPVSVLHSDLRNVVKNNSEADIIFSTPLAKKSFLEKYLSSSNFIKTNNIFSQEEWISKNSQYVPVVKYISRIGYEDRETNIRNVIEKNKDQLPTLYSLIHNNNILIKNIIVFLNQIERQVDIEFESFDQKNKLDREIQTLRSITLENKKVLRAAYMSIFARNVNASKIIRNRKIIIILPATLNYQSGGLIKGLAENNTIEVWAPGAEEHSGRITELLGFNDNYLERASYRISMDFVNKATSAVELYYSHDAVFTASRIVQNWVDAGIPASEIAVVDNYSNINKSFSKLGALLSRPLCGQKSIMFGDSKIAIFIKKIIENRNDLSAASDYFKGYEHLIDDVAEVMDRTASEGDKILSLAELIVKDSINKPKIDSGDILWANSFLEYVNKNKTIDFNQCIKDIPDIKSNSVTYGDSGNVSLLTYGEVTNFDLSHICVIAREHSEYSFELASPEVLSRYPEIVRDSYKEQLQIISDGFANVAFSVDATSSDNKYYQEMRAVKNISSIASRVSKDDIVMVNDLYKEFNTFKANRKELSVSDVTSFTNCSIGWKIGKMLKINPDINNAINLHKGIHIHSIMEQAVSQGFKQTKDMLTNGTCEPFNNFKEISTDLEAEESYLSLLYYMDILQPLFEYANNHLSEIDMKLKLDSGLSIFARTDLVLSFPEGYIIVDYKLNKPSASNNNQALMYPSMFFYNQSEYGLSNKDVLGFLYLGVNKRVSDLYLNSEIENVIRSKPIRLLQEALSIKKVESKKWYDGDVESSLDDASLLKVFSKAIEMQKKLNDDTVEWKVCDYKDCAHNYISSLFREYPAREVVYEQK